MNSDGPGRILAVDDIELNRIVLSRMLGRHGHEVMTASSGREALESAAEHDPEVILLDVQMPDMDGFESCRRLKSLAATSSIPVIFVTANHSEPEDHVQGLEAGAYDYITKPVESQMLLARVDVMLRIRRAEQRLREASMFEELTGVFSRKYVFQRLAEEMARAERSREPVSVSMLDLDHFKSLNDRYGHAFGDEVLRSVARVLRDDVRRYDNVGRYGGEEFLIVLPSATSADAVGIMDRVQSRVAGLGLESQGEAVPVAFSAGICEWDFQTSVEETVERADQALYRAKNAGRGRSVAFEAPKED